LNGSKGNSNIHAQPEWLILSLSKAFFVKQDQAIVCIQQQQHHDPSMSFVSTSWKASGALDPVLQRHEGPFEAPPGVNVVTLLGSFQCRKLFVPGFRTRTSPPRQSVVNQHLCENQNFTARSTRRLD
jgi:hypothetical protein